GGLKGSPKPRVPGVKALPNEPISGKSPALEPSATARRPTPSPELLAEEARKARTYPYNNEPRTSRPAPPDKLSQDAQTARTYPYNNEPRTSPPAAPNSVETPDGVIYKRTNPKSGEGYVGQAKSPER